MAKKSFGQRFKAAIKGFREGVWWPQMAGADADEIGWRRLTGNAERDLDPLAQERMQEVAYYLYETDPLAKRVLELTASYVVAEGAELDADDDAVQEVLDEFWHDPVNNMDLKLERRVVELGLWGEQCYPVFVNPVSGKVRLGYLDPSAIQAVEQDPENAEITRAVVQKDAVGRAGKTYRVVALDEDPASPTFDLRIGDCFYFKINTVTTASRGRSDLLCTSDFMDLLNQFVFTRAERTSFANAWIWDVTLEGMNADEIRTWLREHGVPKPGSVRAHNERVKWEAVAPDLKAHDAGADARLIKNYILTGHGFPEHYFAEGGETTRATAAEMNEPVIKTLTTRQKYVKAMLRDIVDFVIDQAILAGRLSREVDRTYDLHFPEISSKDLGKFGTVLVQIAQALLIAQEQGWIDHDNAAGLFASVASSIGPDVEPIRHPEESGLPAPAEGNPNPDLPVDDSIQRARFAMRRVK